MQKQKINFAITINAPKQRVWDTMLQDATYREWAALFVAAATAMKAAPTVVIGPSH